MEKYRGDTFLFHITLEDDEGGQYFQAGDVVKLGVKKKAECDEYDLYKEVHVEEEQRAIDMIFQSEETSKLASRTYQIEVEITRNNVVETVYRDTLLILEDVIKNE